MHNWCGGKLLICIFDICYLIFDISYMYWADKLALAQDKKKRHRVDDMSTPSGHYHVGSLRAIATHGLVYEAMKHAGYDVDFTYVINDADPMDGMPVYLDKKIYEQHMGKPLNNIPAPDGRSESFAHQYANEYIEAARVLGFNPQIIWSYQDLYKKGAMNDYIKLALDNADIIRNIYLKVAKQNKPTGWYPFQVICPECGKVGTSLVTAWDGHEVAYECKTDLVKWAQGCGHKGKTSPYNGTGKLMWKVDWPAHWAALGVTVEGAGKEHLTAGGSRDIGIEIVKKVFKKDPPYGFIHEFLLIGGAKMSGSRGNAMNAADFVKILPPPVMRFLFVRVPYQRAINFDPTIPNTIPDLFDEYDRCAKSWFESGTKSDFGRHFEASQLGEVPKEGLYLPRFKTLVGVVNSRIDLVDFFANQKGSPLTTKEREILEERIKYANIYLERFAPQEQKLKLIETPEFSASEKQKDFLSRLAESLTNIKSSDRDSIQTAVFASLKQTDIPAKQAFQAFYQTLIGRDAGPRAADLILQFGRDKVIERLNEIDKI